jgi:MFS family permease
MLHRNPLVHNYIVNLLDAAFFGIGIGFASWGTIFPLFISKFTNAQILIGLIPAIHAVGWTGPQLFLAGIVARQKRYKPFVMWMTMNERIPILIMAGVAWYATKLGVAPVLALTFTMLAWQGLGGGFTANPWQSMIAKIFPPNQRGTFLGLQAAVANITMAIGALYAGILLEALPFPANYAVCFAIAAMGLFLSWGILGMTIEQSHDTINNETPLEAKALFRHISKIWNRDGNFRLFMVIRNLSQFGAMGFAFFIVYINQQFKIGEAAVGELTAVLFISQVLGNLTLGWLGDRIGNRIILIAGAIFGALATLLAILAPDHTWFFMVMPLMGIANVTAWTIMMSMTLHFGSEHERPVYIGMANTLVAPSTIAAPVIGGLLADFAGFEVTFWTGFAFWLVTIGYLVTLKDPARNKSFEPNPKEVV